MAAVLLQPRVAAAAPLAIGSVKANAGHSEPGAGFSGLIRLVRAMAWDEVAPNAQLRALNPHVGSALRRHLGVLPMQLAALASPWSKELTLLSKGLTVLAKELTLGGVSSFGYSGTIAHAVLQAEQGAQSLTPVMPMLPLKRRAFPWRDPVHPLLQLSLIHI